MAKEKSLVEEAILSMKNLEEAVAENAKGILASTMKEEIKELVKESLTEQEDEIETDVDMDVETPADDLMMADDDTEMDTDNLDTDIDMDDTIDLTGEDTESIMKVFKLMGPEDSITVVKDEAGNINLKDEDKEYMLVGESEEEEESMEEYYDEEMEMDESDDEEMEMDESDDEEMEMDESDDVDDIVNKVFGEQSSEEDEEDESVVYEISFDDEDEDEDEMFEGEEDDEEDMDEDSHLEESKITSKPKGKGFGSASKFKFAKKPNMAGGFKEKMKEGPKSVGTGKAKFEYKEGENLCKKLGKNTVVKAGTKKVETKEASRTLGSGSKFRKGGLPKPRAHSKFNTAIEESTSQKEVQILREKNEEYRKALNVFRNKLNEVAVFNSNLAYATRLFTEHSTSKQEKINILRRFDSVENIKESKNLYKTIKDELSSTSTQVQTVTESVEKRIEKSPSSGSAANLIESKTYENPQFLRMKDLMSKLK
jgi:hypothetical protein